MFHSIAYISNWGNKKLKEMWYGMECDMSGKDAITRKKDHLMLSNILMKKMLRYWRCRQNSWKKPRFRWDRRGGTCTCALKWKQSLLYIGKRDSRGLSNLIGHSHVVGPCISECDLLAGREQNEFHCILYHSIHFKQIQTMEHDSIPFHSIIFHQSKHSLKFRTPITDTSIFECIHHLFIIFRLSIQSF